VSKARGSALAGRARTRSRSVRTSRSTKPDQAFHRQPGICNNLTDLLTSDASTARRARPPMGHPFGRGRPPPMDPGLGLGVAGKHLRKSSPGQLNQTSACRLPSSAGAAQALSCIPATCSCPEGIASEENIGKARRSEAEWCSAPGPEGVMGALGRVEIGKESSGRASQEPGLLSALFEPPWPGLGLPRPRGQLGARLQGSHLSGWRISTRGRRNSYEAPALIGGKYPKFVRGLGCLVLMWQVPPPLFVPSAALRLMN